MPGDLPQPPPLIDLLEFRGALPNMAIAKLTTGIPGFDILTHGGIPEGRTTLVVGPQWNGQDCLQPAAGGALRETRHPDTRARRRRNRRGSDAGDEDAVVFTLTLVKRGPGSRTYIVGNLNKASIVADLLDVSGVKPLRERA
jgi:hypothetical protein